MADAVTLQVGTNKRPEVRKERLQVNNVQDLDAMLEALRKKMSGADADKGATLGARANNLFDGVVTPRARAAPVSNGCERYEELGFKVIQAVVCCVRDAGHRGLQHILADALRDTNLDPGAVAPAPVYTANTRDQCGRRFLSPWVPFPSDVYQRFCTMQREIATRRDALLRYAKRLETLGQQSQATSGGVLHHIVPVVLKILRQKRDLADNMLAVRREANRANQKARNSMLLNLMIVVTDVLKAFEADLLNVVLRYRDYVNQINAARAARRETSQSQYERRLEAAVRDFGAWLRGLKGVVPSTIVLSSEASQFLVDVDCDAEDCGTSRLRTMLSHVERVRAALDMMSADGGPAAPPPALDAADEQTLEVQWGRTQTDLDSVRRDLAALDQRRAEYWGNKHSVRKSMDGLRELEDQYRKLEERQTALFEALDELRNRRNAASTRNQHKNQQIRRASAQQALLQARDWDARLRDLQAQAAQEMKNWKAKHGTEHALRNGIRDETVRTLAELYSQAVSKIDGAGLIMANSVAQAVRARLESATRALQTLGSDYATAEASLSVYEQRFAVDPVASPLMQRYRSAENEWRSLTDQSLCMQLMSEVVKESERNIRAYEDWDKKRVVDQ